MGKFTEMKLVLFKDYYQGPTQQYSYNQKKKAGVFVETLQDMKGTMNVTQRETIETVV